MGVGVKARAELDRVAAAGALRPASVESTMWLGGPSNVLALDGFVALLAEAGVEGSFLVSADAVGVDSPVWVPVIPAPPGGGMTWCVGSWPVWSISGRDRAERARES